MFKSLNFKKLLIIALTSLLVLAIVLDSIAQCTPSNLSENTSAVSCSSCNTNIASGTTASVTIGTTGNTWCVPSNQTSTITDLYWNNGILNVCGTLTIGTLHTGGGFPPSVANPAYIYVGTGASLTITAFSSTTSSLIDGCGISNRGGTLTFSGNVTVNSSGGNAWIITANSSSTTTFNGTFKVNAQDNFISRGKTVFNQNVNLNTNAGFCLEKSYTEFNSTFTNGGYMYYNGTTAATDAIINYNSTMAFGGSGMVNSVATNSNIKFCKNTSGTSYTSSFCTANGGSGGACPTSSLGVYASYSNSSCSNPLPVILSHFSASNIIGGVLLNWTTSQEFNNKNFILERSFDGHNYEYVSTIDGQGTKSSSTYYIYHDGEIGNYRVVYYRLKQIDLDGEYVYSQAIFLRNGESQGVLIYPNPLNENQEFTIKFGDDDEGDAIVSIFDISGKLITVNTMYNILPNSIHMLNIYSKSVCKGTYLVQIKSLQNVYNQKIDLN